MINQSFALTPLNHGKFGNPHPQYGDVQTFQTAVDSSTDGVPWMKIFEVKMGSLEQNIENTLSRLKFGFKAIDNASDSMPSVVYFTGSLAIDYSGNLVVNGLKKYLYRDALNTNKGSFNMHIFYQKGNDNSYTVKVYLTCGWKYKRIAIIQPWIDLPIDRYVTTVTNPLLSKISMSEKTRILFQNIEGETFISLTDLAADVGSSTNFSVPEEMTVTASTTFSLAGSLQAVLTRIGNNVTIGFRGGAGDTDLSGTLGTLPTGYRPSSSSGIATFRYDGNGAVSPVLISSNGSVSLLTALAAGKLLYGSGSYNTIDDFPGGI
ncbi:hypothetical protein [Lactiplantibacillus carotarum]|uniref:hypothetical protein n=1 Tax=Lactiplantibacillus carotarum TaxID=2993456 RepID=UPI00298F26D0|nr:hypothetical protein [Lactiplantibacillus carotarum]